MAAVTTPILEMGAQEVKWPAEVAQHVSAEAWVESLLVKMAPAAITRNPRIYMYNCLNAMRSMFLIHIKYSLEFLISRGLSSKL